MGALGFGFVIGLCFVGVAVGVLVFAAMLGIPLETRARQEKLAALAVWVEVDRQRGKQPQA